LIWFLDADDYIHPGSLESLNHIFESNRGIDYVGFEYNWTKAKYGSDSEWESLQELTYEVWDCNDRNGFDAALHHSPIGVCCVCYKRQSLSNMGLHFENLRSCEDRLFSLQACFSANTVAHLPKRLYHYLQRDASATHSVTLEFIEDQRKFVEALLELDAGKRSSIRRYIAVMLHTETFPSMMRNIMRIAPASAINEAFNNLLQAISYAREVYPETPPIGHADHVLRHRSFLLAWILLYVRYEPRRFLMTNPWALRLYRRLRPI
jgi:hypothetical protein